MRLLSTETLTLHDFVGEQIPPYAILSHTWGDQELTYRDMLEHTRPVKRKAGYKKMFEFTVACKHLGYHYCWIDTCCIDKSSSSELTEALNSMFMWYRKAAVCFAFLEDITVRREWSALEHTALGNLANMEYIAHSRWFTRGWTLQELIAPRHVIFVDRNWHTLSVRAETLSKITGIPEKVLQSGMTDDISVAQKMCWAANRRTTRVEDIAYCLMGIFDVNMPLLYGEGMKAFTRLQEEIIRKSTDETIFLWADRQGDWASYRGIFAKHPSEFKDCKSSARLRDVPSDPLPFNMTNAGLQMNVKLLPLSSLRHEMSQLPSRFKLVVNEDKEEYFVPILHCADSYSTLQSILLKRLKKGGRQYARVETFTTMSLPMEIGDRIISALKFQQIYVLQTVRPSDIPPATSKSDGGFRLIIDSYDF